VTDLFTVYTTTVEVMFLVPMKTTLTSFLPKHLGHILYTKDLKLNIQITINKSFYAHIKFSSKM